MTTYEKLQAWERGFNAFFADVNSGDNPPEWGDQKSEADAEADDGWISAKNKYTAIKQ